MLMTNQLLDEAEAVLPELDEYDNCSVVDICHAIIAWPADSEDQKRAIAAIRLRAPHLGHNRPPLAERLDVDLAEMRGRADALLAVAKTALIVDGDSAAKVMDLSQKMREVEEELDELRKCLSRPYRDAIALIKTSVDAIADPLGIVRQGPDGRGGLRLMLTQWDDKVRAEAAAARQKAEAEQREREEAAAAARRRLEEQANAGKNVAADELRAAEAEEEAERARQRAEAIRPAPIRSDAGVLARAREISFTIDNVRQAIGAILKLPGGLSAAEQFVRTFLGKYLRGVGVAAVEKGVTIAGVSVTVELRAANVRR
jgi:hypothetical protein